MEDLENLPTSDCTRHECDTKNEHMFSFWMYKLPSSVRTSLLSNLPSMLYDTSYAEKAKAIQSLSALVVPGFVARLLEQVTDCHNSVTFRRDAFLSLKIIVDM